MHLPPDAQVQELMRTITRSGDSVGDRDMLEIYKLLLPKVLDSNSVASLLHRELTTEQVRVHACGWVRRARPSAHAKAASYTSPCQRPNAPPSRPVMQGAGL